MNKSADKEMVYRHYDSLPILIEFIKKAKGSSDEEIARLAYKALSDWDRARG